MYRPNVKYWSWKLFWYMVRHPFLCVSTMLELEAIVDKCPMCKQENEGTILS